MVKWNEISGAQAAKILLAGYILVLLLLQLFSFDTFPAMLMGIGLGSAVSYVVAIALVVIELLSLPFLLQMKLPKKIFLASMISGGLALLTLSVLEVVAFLDGLSVIFGATFELPGGVWSLLLLLALWLLFAWGVLDEIGLLSTKKKVSSKKK